MRHVGRFVKKLFKRVVRRDGGADEGARQDAKLVCELLRFLTDYAKLGFDAEEPDALNEAKERQRRCQEQLCAYKVPNLVLAMLCRGDVDFVQDAIMRRVFNSSLACLLALLQDGNSTTQAQVFDYFRRKGGSGFLFRTLAQRIQEAKQVMCAERGTAARTQDLLEDFRFDFERTDKQLGVTELVKFVQQLCEGHYTELQIHVRVQSFGAEDAPLVAHRLPQYNMLRVISDLLHALLFSAARRFRRLSCSRLHVVQQCFDTLIEAIQGPCAENQLDLAESNFMEVIEFSLRNYVQRYRDDAQVDKRADERAEECGEHAD